MIWAILVLVGVPLWLCVLGVTALLYRNRNLRRREGDIPVRVRRGGKTRWTRGHAVWISDVFAWRGSPAAWNEDLLHVIAARPAAPEPQELKKLHRLGDSPTVVILTPEAGEPVRVAVAAEHAAALLGPYGAQQAEADTAH